MPKVTALLCSHKKCKRKEVGGVVVIFVAKWLQYSEKRP